MPDPRDPVSEALGHLSQHANRASNVTPPAEIRRLGERRRQRRQSALAGAGALAIVLGVAGAVVLRPDSDDGKAVIAAATATATTTPHATKSPTATFTLSATSPPTTPADSRPSSPGATPTPSGAATGPAAPPATATATATATANPSRSLETFDVVAVGTAVQRGGNYLRVEMDTRCVKLAELFGGAFRYPSPTQLEGCGEEAGQTTATFHVDPRVTITPLASGSRLTGDDPRSFSTLRNLINSATSPVVVQIRVDADGVIKAIVELSVTHTGDPEPTSPPQAGSS